MSKNHLPVDAPESSSEPPAKRPKSGFKHGKPLTSQAREIVYNVAQFCMQENETFEETDFKKYFVAYKQRASKATGVSYDTVMRVLNHANIEGMIATPKPTKSSAEKKYSGVIDAQFYGKLRDKITELYFQNQVPDINSVTTEMGINIPNYTLSKILRKMGYVFVKTDVRGIAIVETLRSRLKRIQYLDRLKNSRAEGRSTVYINEICVRVLFEHYSEKVKRGKVKWSKPKGKEIPLVLLTVWNENSDVPTPSGILLYPLEDVTDNYENWLRTNLIVDVPDNSALVFTSTLHPNKYMKGYPHCTATTADMKEWLKNQSITVPDNLTKPQLYNTILKNTKDMPLDSGVNFLTDNGYVVLQTPNYHWGLNPIEIIWPKLVVYLTEQTPMNVESRTMEELNKILPEEWRNAREESMKIEQRLMENEAAMDEITDLLYLHYDKRHDAEEDWSSEDEDYNFND